MLLPPRKTYAQTIGEQDWDVLPDVTMLGAR
jgi:hypothetical protein